MSVTTIILITAGIFFLFLLAGAFIWIINRSTVKAAVSEAVSNSKSSLVNHGTIVNNYYGREVEENKTASDDVYIQLSRCAGEFTKQLLPKPEDNPKPVRRKRKK
jgi:hypothetical protein